MRPSQKNRGPRNKGGRNKPLGNVVNRVFESAGPEGKVRGTPQQIIDKYHLLARDAQTSGDRVTAENFLQHAEHYARMLSAAYEQAEERRQQVMQVQGGSRGDSENESSEEESEGGYREERREPRDHRREDRPERQDEREVAQDAGGEPTGRRRGRGRDRAAPEGAPQAAEPSPGGALETIDTGGGDDESPLVQTPEEQSAEPRPEGRRRTRRAPKKVEAEAPEGAESAPEGAESDEAAAS